MKKVLLIQPPLNKESMLYGTMDPYSLTILAAGLREKLSNIEVAIIDFRVEKKKKALKKLIAFNPDFVGITGITVDKPEMLKMLDYIKEQVSEKCVTIVGGHHATLVPEDFFRNSCDIIVQGPGINALCSIVSLLGSDSSHKEKEKILKKIKGIVYRKENNTFAKTVEDFNYDEIASWPLPAYDLIKQYKRKYMCFGYSYSVVTTAQGCPFKCSFCSCWKVFNGKYSIRNAEEVVEQVKAAPNKHIFFGDDLSFANVKQAKKIAELIKKEGIKKIYSGYCRADIIIKNPELFKTWKEIGLQGLIVGMESFSEDDLEYYNKKTSMTMNKEANSILLNLGLHNYANFMVKPTYTNEDFKKLSQYSLSLGTTYPAFSVLTPLPGTDLMDDVAHRLVTTESQFFDFAHPVMDIKKENIDSFYKNLEMLYFKNYSYSRWIVNTCRAVTNAVMRRDIFTKEAIQRPMLIAIIYIRIWFRFQTNKKKIYKEKIA
ncbi:MAG: radical SAM protein [bacterium]|nr:radical SAM protein [bacterium]